MRTFILLLLMQLVSLPFSYARQPEHSTYLVAHDLKSLDYVRQIDYAQFAAARSLREGYPGKTECAGKPEEPENVSYYGSSLLAALFQRTCRKGFPVTRLDQYHDLRHGRRNLGQCTYPQHSSGPDHYRSESLGNV